MENWITKPGYGKTMTSLWEDFSYCLQICLILLMKRNGKQKQYKNAGENEHLVDGLIKDVPDATMFDEEHVYETNLVEVVAQPAPLTEPSDMKTNLIQPHLFSPTSKVKWTPRFTP